MKKTFTKTAVIALYFMLMANLGVIAAVPATANKNAKEAVRREIIRNISCPEFITNDSEANQVKAIVEVSETGVVNIDEINSANPQLQNYVIGQLQNMKVTGTGTTEKFVLVIKFKVA